MQIPLRSLFHLCLKTAINLNFIHLEIKFVIHGQHCFLHKNRSVNALYRNNSCLSWELCDNHKCVLWANCRIFIAKHLGTYTTMSESSDRQNAAGGSHASLVFLQCGQRSNSRKKKHTQFEKYLFYLYSYENNIQNNVCYGSITQLLLYLHIYIYIYIYIYIKVKVTRDRPRWP